MQLIILKPQNKKIKNKLRDDREELIIQLVVWIMKNK
jgi:hypothetical protein